MKHEEARLVLIERKGRALILLPVHLTSAGFHPESTSFPRVQHSETWLDGNLPQIISFNFRSVSLRLFHPLRLSMGGCCFEYSCFV